MKRKEEKNMKRKDSAYGRSTKFGFMLENTVVVSVNLAEEFLGRHEGGFVVLSGDTYMLEVRDHKERL